MSFRKLIEARPVVGGMIAEFPMPAMPWLLANAGFDFFIADLEHGPFGIERVGDLCKVGRLAGVAGLVRVPDNQYPHVARALDAGAVGVVVPRVESADDVRRAVAAARYPPFGRRGFAGRRAHCGYGSGGMSEIVRVGNETNLVIVQIERVEAVSSLDAILDVPGLDMVFIGPNDLSLALGSSDPGEPEVVDAMEHVVVTATQRGVWVGVHSANVRLLRRCRELGARMLSCTSDVDLILDGAGQRCAELKS